MEIDMLDGGKSKTVEIFITLQGSVMLLSWIKIGSSGYVNLTGSLQSRKLLGKFASEHVVLFFSYRSVAFQIKLR